MYDFENKDKIPFKDLTGEQMKLVVSANTGLVEVCSKYSSWGGVASSKYYDSSIYRVKSAPHTLEDALAEARNCAEEANVFPHSQMVIPLRDAVSIITMIAASMEASK